MVVAICLALFFSVFFYVQSFKYALSPKRWAILGLLTGPVALPLFNVHRQMKWRRAVGFENVFIKA